MTFNPWTFLFEILNFLVLAFVLHRLLYKPLRKAIETRIAANNLARTEAVKARKDADEVKRQLTAKLAETDRQRQDVLQKAAEQVDAEKAKRLAEATAEGKAIREQAQLDSDHLRQDTINELEASMEALAIELAERLLKQACNTSLNAQIARRLSETIRGVTSEEQEQVRRDAGTSGVVIESATSLDDTTRNDLTAALRELVGSDCEVKYELKPNLVGGVLVRIGGHVWDGTFLAQFEAAKAKAGSTNVKTG